MQDGDDSARPGPPSTASTRRSRRVDPRSPTAEAFFDDAVRQLNDALDARRDRLDDAGGGLPWVIGALLLVGSLVIVGYAILVGSRSFWFHAIGAGSIALVVGLSLVVLVALVYPFSGDLAIDSGPIQDGASRSSSGAVARAMGWLDDLSTGWLALVVSRRRTSSPRRSTSSYGTRAGRRAEAFKAVSSGLLPPMGLLFGLLVGFLAAQVWSDSARAQVAVDREASACGRSISSSEAFPGEPERACGFSSAATSRRASPRSGRRWREGKPRWRSYPPHSTTRCSSPWRSRPNRRSEDRAA